MTISEFITKKVNPNLSQSAFFLGNGINNYCGGMNSWKELLINLAIKHIGKNGKYEEILNDNSVSYPEFFDLIQLSYKAKDKTFDYESIKKEIKNGMKKWSAQATHSLWTDKLIDLNRPVLTTNYDNLLELSNQGIIDFVKRNQYNKKLFRPQRIKNPASKSGFTPYYPWHSYYSNRRIEVANEEFAIWHVHGCYEYLKSIRLGLTDYMGIVEKGRHWLLKSSGNPIKDIKYNNKWVGKNSWLDIFFSNNLLFIGVELGVQEISLRWLLIEREKLYLQNPELRRKTWFIENLEFDKIKFGKQLFFEKLNIEIIDAENYDQIYKEIPLLLRL